MGKTLSWYLSFFQNPSVHSMSFNSKIAKLDYLLLGRGKSQGVHYVLSGEG